MIWSGLTEGVVERAVWITELSIRLLLRSSLTKEDTGVYAVVLKPWTTDILWKDSFGRGGEEFRQFALDKALLCAATRMSGSSMHTEAPWNHQPRGIRYAGGLYDRGLAIGVSGVQAYFDETIARWLRDSIWGICQYEQAQIMAGDPAYLSIPAEEDNGGRVDQSVHVGQIAP